MIASFRAELVRLMRRRVMLGAGLVVLVFGVGGAQVVLSTAKPAAQVKKSDYSPTFEGLSSAGGGSELFRFAAAFAGTLVFVVFVGLFALEFSRGTYRTMLLRQPLRARLLAGRLAALLSFAAVVLAASEVLMWFAGLLLAGSHVSTTAWPSAAGFGHAITDYRVVLVWVTGYAVLAMMVAVLLRSLPLALAVGIAWSGPIEHLVGGSWVAGARFFPGLLLEDLAQGGTATVSGTRAFVTVAIYIVVAAGIAFGVFSRRDVAT